MKFFKKRFGIPFLLILVFFLFYRANYEAPILMYHHVGDSADQSSTNLSTEAFRRQMHFLRLYRYRVIGLKEFLIQIRSGRRVPMNTVVITFDDGYLDNIKNAFPILKELNFPATVFMITRNINEPGWLSEEDLRILDDSAVSTGSHTVNHAFLPQLDEKVALFELRESKKRLEKILGHPVLLFSYPAGGVTRQIKELVEKEGYEGAVTTNYGRKTHDPFVLHRIKATEGGGNLFGFWIKVSGLYHLGKKRIEVERPWPSQGY